MFYKIRKYLMLTSILSVLLFVAFISSGRCECEHDWLIVYDNVNTPMEHFCFCHNCFASYYEYHYATCDHPDTCAVCGDTIAKGGKIYDVRHFGPNEYDFDRDECWLVCTACNGAHEHIPHYATCERPDECYRCGKTTADGIVISEKYHEIDRESLYEYHMINETDCGKYCAYCGELREVTYHEAWCDNPNQCSKCGATSDELVMAYRYHTSWEWQHNETEHWQVCSGCGETKDLDLHYARCTDPERCTKCRVTVEEGIILDRIAHSRYNTYSVEVQGHWMVCMDCEEILSYGYHYGTCDAPETCRTCGATTDDGIEIKEVVHYYNVFTWRWYYDEHQHWLVCPVCGSNNSEYVHWAYCTEPDVCGSCGMSIDEGFQISEIDHFYPYIYPRVEPSCTGTGLSEWERCLACGEILIEGEIIPELGHLAVSEMPVLATIGQNGRTGRKYCGRCGDTLSESVTIESTRILRLPTSLQTIGQNAFAGNDAQQIMIPSGVTQIGSKAFADCLSLEVIVIPASVISIANDAFDGSDNVVIVCGDGSYAQRFAEDNGICCCTD